MVKTRHSVGGEAHNDLSSLDPKASKALQKLKIAGKDALMGEKEKKERNVRVYHYRGAVYEVEEGTKAEWVENQPKRYQKRQREAEEGDNDAFAGAKEEDEAPRPAKRARKSMPEHPRSNITLSSRDQAYDKRHSMPSSRTTQPAVPRSARKSAKKPTPAPPRTFHDDDDDEDLEDEISPVPAQHTPIPDHEQYAREISQQREMARGRLKLEPYTEQELYNNATASALARLQRNQKAVKVALEQYELARELLERKKREKGEREMGQMAVSDEGDGMQTPPGEERIVQESSPLEERERGDVEMQDDFYDAPEYDGEVVDGGLARDKEVAGDAPTVDHQVQPEDQLTEELKANNTPPATAGAAQSSKSPILDPNKHDLGLQELGEEATGANSYPVGVEGAHDRRASLNPDYARNYRSQTANRTSSQQPDPQHSTTTTTTPPHAHARNHSYASTSPTTTSITGSTNSDSYTAFSNLDPADPLPASDKGGQPLRWSISIDAPRDDVSNANFAEAEYVIRDSKLPEENKMQKRRRMKREHAVCLGWKRSYGGKIMREGDDGRREEWREDGGGEEERRAKRARMSESVVDLT